MGAGASTVEMTAAIPIDTPATGTFRLLGNLGVYNRIPYDSYTGDIYIDINDP